MISVIGCGSETQSVPVTDSSTNTPNRTANVATDPVNPVAQPTFTQPTGVIPATPTPAKTQDFKTKIKSNVYGATVVVQKVYDNGAEPEEVLRTQFEKQNQFVDVELPPNSKYTIMLELAERVAIQADYQPQPNGEVEINFSDDQFSDLHRAEPACW
ncbi:MAG: hypothetical protein HUJ26_09365 [Planctomycetaceae bacterium]|nr:hypothetical protein [Planctomycetaceae bacterium]